MQPLRTEHRVGADFLETVTVLLQRARMAHPTRGLFEAADLQWWWRNPRSTDELPQLFWFDDLGRPEAAVIVVDWGDGIALVPIVMPDASPEWVADVIGGGLAHIDELGFESLDLEVDRADHVLRDVLLGHGFVAEGDGAADASVSISVVESWLSADARPAVSSLHEGYRLSSRLDTTQRPHHMTKPERGHPDPEARLRQTSLYRPDLDLVIHDSRGDVAAYGLFWYDPTTATGLVEPMRTEDDHQRRGLARHVLTAGINLLADAGAERIKIVFAPNNPAAKGLYLSVGFEPVKETVVFSRRAG